MRIGINFIAERAFMIKDSTYFNTTVLHNGEEVEGSTGKDNYEVNSTVLKGKVFAGLARETTYTSIAVPVFNGKFSAFLDLDNYISGDSVIIKVENNVFLGQGMLTSHGCIKIFDENGNRLETPLAVPGIPIQWPKRGTFLIDISSLMNTFFQKYYLKEAVS